MDLTLNSLLNSNDPAVRGWAQSLVEGKGTTPRRKTAGAPKAEATFTFIPYPFFPCEKGVTRTFQLEDDGGASIRVSMDDHEPVGPEPRYTRVQTPRNGITIRVGRD